MQEEYDSRTTEALDDKSERDTDSLDCDEIQKLQNHSSNSKTEANNTNSDVKADIGAMLHNKSCDSAIDKQLESKPDNCGDCTGDASSVSSNIPKSSVSKDKTIKEPSKEERLGKKGLPIGPVNNDKKKSV